MQLSLIVLKSETILISQSESLETEPRCHLVSPCTISGTTKLSLKRWPLHTGEDHILLRSEDLLTVCEPSDKLIQAYIKKFNLKKEDLEVLTSEPEQVILNEESQPGIESVPDFDEYEPQYIEEP